MKPAPLTVAGIDALVSATHAAEHEANPGHYDWQAMPSAADVLVLCRMARALAVMQERVGYASRIVGDEWAVSIDCGRDDGQARRVVTVGLIEAIEAAEEASK